MGLIRCFIVEFHGVKDSSVNIKNKLFIPYELNNLIPDNKKMPHYFNATFPKNYVDFYCFDEQTKSVLGTSVFEIAE